MSDKGSRARGAGDAPSSAATSGAAAPGASGAPEAPGTVEEPEPAESPDLWFHRRATHYVESQILFHLNQVGIFAALAAGGPCSAAELAQRHGLDERVTQTLLEYVFAIDDLLERDAAGRYALSRFGRKVVERFSHPLAAPDRSGKINLFDVRVGAYAPVWANMSRMLTGAGRYGQDFRRDGAYAEDGVRKLAMKFWPTLHGLIQELQPQQVVEVGLTTGLLQRAGVAHPQLALSGLDQSAAALQHAAESAAKLGVERARWLRGDVFQPEAWAKALSGGGPGLLFSLHFHEFLAAGEEQLVGWLQALRTLLPGWHVVAMEQPLLPQADRAQIPEHEWLYAQSNVLIHHLIGNGRILATDTWLALGRRAGCASVSHRPCGYLGYRAFVFQL